MHAEIFCWSVVVLFGFCPTSPYAIFSRVGLDFEGTLGESTLTPFALPVLGVLGMAI